MRREQEGDYGSALMIARSVHHDFKKFGLTHEADTCVQKVKSLEEKLLTLGFTRRLFDENLMPRENLLQLLQLLGALLRK